MGPEPVVGKRINRGDAGRQPGVAMVDHVQGRSRLRRQIREAHTVRADGDRTRGKRVILCCQEKPRREVLAARTPNRLRWSGREYQGDRDNRG